MFVEDGEYRYGGAIDKPDERDYIAEHILGAATTEIPKSFDTRTKWTTAWNQGNSVMCTLYSTAQTGAIENQQEHDKYIKALFDVMWDYQAEFGTMTKEGDYVQTALKSIVKNGLVAEDGTVYKFSGYAKVEKKDLKSWIAKGYPIVTSADVTPDNFSIAKKTGIWPGVNSSRVTGHAFCLVAYEEAGVRGMNSYGPKWGKFGDGTFIIPNSQVGDLGTCYVLYDIKDSITQPKMIFKDVSEDSPNAAAIKWAKEQGITNGYDDGRFGPGDNITRAQMVQMLYNMAHPK